MIRSFKPGIEASSGISITNGPFCRQRMVTVPGGVRGGMRVSVSKTGSAIWRFAMERHLQTCWTWFHQQCRSRAVRSLLEESAAVVAVVELPPLLPLPPVRILRPLQQEVGSNRWVQPGPYPLPLACLAAMTAGPGSEPAEVGCRLVREQ